MRTPYAFAPGDAAFACFALALGFLCWEFRLGSNLGAFIILAVALAGSFVYLHRRGARQSKRSLAAFAVCAAGALPFLLYDATDIYVFLMLFELCACFYWILLSTGNSVDKELSGFILADWLNQTFVIPFSNFPGIFICAKTASRDAKRGKSALIAVVGIVIAIPLIIGVTSLLIRSDRGFAQFSEGFADWAGLDDIGVYLLEFIAGVPIACYIFGSVAGGVQKRYTAIITREKTEKGLSAVRRLPRAAVLSPLAILCALYIVYISVMGVYLFSAFGGKLPEGFSSYAEYARQGFFELCGVAAINLVVLAFVYSFARRAAGEYPKALRLLTCLLCVMTELLTFAAVSKMLLYIDAYGLSRLRVYTLWFLALLFVVFALLTVWHIRPYLRARAGGADTRKAGGTGSGGASPRNIGRPIAVVSVCFMLALFLANTDGLIAKYNVWQYQSGHAKTVDTEMLSHMSDAVLPYLDELQTTTGDESLRYKLFIAYCTIRERKAGMDEMFTVSPGGLNEMPATPDDWHDWNIQTAMTQKTLLGT